MEGLFIRLYVRLSIISMVFRYLEIQGLWVCIGDADPIFVVILCKTDNINHNSETKLALITASTAMFSGIRQVTNFLQRYNLELGVVFYLITLKPQKSP